MSVISEEKLKEIWSKLSESGSDPIPSSIATRTLEGLGDLGKQMASGGGRLAIELPEALWDWGRGQAFNERQFFQYDADMRENATREYISSKFPALDRMLSYEGDTPIAQMGKEGGERIANFLNPFWEKAAQSSPLPAVFGEPGVRGDVAISTGGPIASVVGASRLLSSPTARAAATKTSGSAQVTLARKIDNFRDKHGLADKNLLMDTARRVGEDRWSMGAYTTTQKNNLRKVESDIKALNRFQPREAGKPVGAPHIGGWYSSPTAKYFHLINMVYEALKNAPDARAVLKGSEELFTPNILRELQTISSQIPRVYESAGAGMKGATANVFADQLGHVLAANQLYYPYSPRTQWMTDKLGKDIFPDSIPLMNMRDFGASDIQALMEPYFRGALTDPKILDAHMTDFFKLGKNDGTLRLQTKPMFTLNNFKTSALNDSIMGARTWEGIGGNKWGVHSWRGKLPVMMDAEAILKSWNRMRPDKRPELTQDYIIEELLKRNGELRKDYDLNVVNWKSQAWKYMPQAGNLLKSGRAKRFVEGGLEIGEYWKKRPQLRLYNEKELRNNIKVANGYVSAQQQAIIPDTMLATVTGRAIWPKNNVDGGILVAADSYQMGSGGLDRPLAIGAAENNVFFIDAIPWNTAYNATQGKGKLLEMNGKPNSAVLANITKTGSYREIGEKLAGVPYMKPSPLGPRHFLREPPLKRTKKGVISYHEPQ